MPPESGGGERLASLQILLTVIDEGRSLDHALAEHELGANSLVRALCFGVMRWRWRLQFCRDRLLRKPLKARDTDIQLLLLIGLFQLDAMRVPPHAAINETVALTRQLGKVWARGLVNAVLRNYQRQRQALLAELDRDPVASSSHPQWLIELIRRDWPEQVDAILAANNAPAPMCLRVNRQRGTRAQYLQRLSETGISASPGTAATAIYLDEPRSVRDLPGFEHGDCSVQDEAAQWAAELLGVQAGMTVLDACSAPGGKTAALLEHEPGLVVTATDIDAERLKRVQETLARIDLAAETAVADASEVVAWADGRRFDRILLDAPCSGLGVIRRHPDIKSLRRPQDIAASAKRQRNLLTQLWQVLKPGGQLLYATCSIARDENDRLLAQWLKTQADARPLPLAALPGGKQTGVCLQFLPEESAHDGFAYALLEKTG